MKKWLLLAARIVIAGVAMYFALRKINWQEVKQFDWGISLFWLLPAIVLYNLSQFTSAFRLLQFYRIYQTAITYIFNLKLYYRGMFYNLFLPGGIGGDAYKIIALKNAGNTYKQLTTATLLDRTTGLSMLMLIVTVLSTTISLKGLFDRFFDMLPVLMVLGLPAYAFVVHYFFRPFSRLLPGAWALSLCIQALQMLAFFCVLMALQAQPVPFVKYAFLFFVSSVISALPISIGGIGTRELALATGAAYFHFSEAKLVSASLLFFLMVVASSLVGWSVSSPEGKTKVL